MSELMMNGSLMNWARLSPPDYAIKVSDIEVDEIVKSDRKKEILEIRKWSKQSPTVGQRFCGHLLICKTAFLHFLSMN